MGWGLPLYQVASWSIQPFGHNRHGPKIGGSSSQFSANVRCGQTAGWTKMPLDVAVGLGPGDFVFDGDLAPPENPHPSFGPCLLWPNGWMDQDATWFGGKLLLRRRCVRWGWSSPLKGVHPPVFGPCVLKDGWRHHLVRKYRPRPRPHCIMRGPSSPAKGAQQTPSFRPMSIVATVAHLSYCWALVLSSLIYCSSFTVTVFYYIANVCVSRFYFTLLITDYWLIDTVSRWFSTFFCPVHPFRHGSNGDCVQGKTENYHAFVQYCVEQLCTVRCTHIWTDLTVLWIGFCLTGPISLWLDSFLCMYVFCVSLYIACFSTVTWWGGPGGVLRPDP